MQKNREFLYDPNTGKLWREAGSADGRGYRHVQFEGRSHLAHRVAWLLYYGEWPSGFLDHINGNPSDNRIINLRLADVVENQHNRGKSKNNTSGFKGVSSRRGKWQALISINGKNRYLGLFTTCEEASAAYDQAALQHHGEFVKLDL